MKRYVLLWMLLSVAVTGFTQDKTVQEQAKVYQATPEKINNLVHTKMEARFDYTKSQLVGKAWLTLKPHFYPTDTLELDAKGMDIREVSIVKNARNGKLQYDYDGMVLKVKLDKTYRN